MADSLEKKENLNSEDNKKCRPDWITCEFVAQILRKYESDDSLDVTDISFTELKGESEGHASDMFFVSASITKGETKVGDRSLAFKCLAEGGDHQKFLAKTSIFDREIDMYSKVIPEMTELLEKAAPGKYGLLAPKCYHWQFEPKPLLVLEDLRSSGYIVPSRLLGLDYDHIQVVLKKLAQFHASSAVVCARNPDYIELYKKPYFLETDDATSHWIKCLTSMGRSFADEVQHWPEFGKKTSDDINRFMDNMTSTLEYCLWKNEKEFNTLVHCDMWVNNFLFLKSADAKSIEDMRFIDFQMTQFGSPTIDFAMLMTLCPNKEVREMPQETLLYDYYKELTDVLTLLRYPLKIPTFDEIKEAFHRRAGYAFNSAAVDLPIVLAECDFDYGQTLEDEKPERNPLYSSQRYREIMYKLIPFYKEKGVL